MKKFWIVFDKKNSRCLFQSEDRQKTTDWARSFLVENPSRGMLFILEAVSVARLTAAPIEVVELTEPPAPPKTTAANSLSDLYETRPLNISDEIISDVRKAEPSARFYGFTAVAPE